MFLRRIPADPDFAGDFSRALCHNRIVDAGFDNVRAPRNRERSGIRGRRF